VTAGGIGAIQFGVMYIAYIYSFQLLQAYEVALLTITTPLYVVILHDAFVRRWNPAHLASAVLAIGGAAVVVVSSRHLPEAVLGIAAVQVSNLCFAFGQLAYARAFGARGGGVPARHFAALYAGALAVTAIAAGLTVDWGHLAITPRQWWTLVYLGAIASGVCFFLWNSGARTVNPGTLAVLNNVKIPLSVACSLVFFGEQADLMRLLLGGVLMALALALAERTAGKRRVAAEATSG
jgi:drug/metabolite transporter (DMT)-like permease